MPLEPTKPVEWEGSFASPAPAEPLEREKTLDKRVGRATKEFVDGLSEGYTPPQPKPPATGRDIVNAARMHLVPQQARQHMEGVKRDEQARALFRKDADKQLRKQEERQVRDLADYELGGTEEERERALNYPEDEYEWDQALNEDDD